MHDIKNGQKSKDQIYRLKLQWELDRLMYLIELQSEQGQKKRVDG